MHDQDLRWQRRFQYFLIAFLLLEEGVVKHNNVGISNLEEQGLVERFEFTRELAWNVFKDYFEYQGNNDITGSRDATREAFKKGLIDDGESWMEMINSRNLSSHTFNEEISKEIEKADETLLQFVFEIQRPHESIKGLLKCLV